METKLTKYIYANSKRNILKAVHFLYFFPLGPYSIQYTYSGFNTDTLHAVLPLTEKCLDSRSINFIQSEFVLFSPLNYNSISS